MMKLDELRKAVLRARERVRGWFGRAAVVSKAKVLPYHLWQDLPQRPAGKMANTRQCIRARQRRLALQHVNQKHGADPRKARRNIARGLAKAAWQAWRVDRAGALLFG
jgi:hypothetical protein